MHLLSVFSLRNRALIALLTIVVGVAFNARVRTATDYLIAGRNLGLVFTTASLVAVQVGVPFVTAPLQNVAGDHFVFTVIEARPSGPADSLEEVREKVAQDVLANKAFQRLTSNIDAFKNLAVSDGLEAVGKLAVEGTTAAAPTPRIQVRIAKDEQGRFDPA